MITSNQLANKKRKKRRKKTNRPALRWAPQKKGICIKVFTGKPKKPNSAIRKLARVTLTSKMTVTVAIPGQGHNLQKFSVVMIRGGRSRDVPGVRYKLIRGKYDLTTVENFQRNNARSKYGIKKKK